MLICKYKTIFVDEKTGSSTYLLAHRSGRFIEKSERIGPVCLYILGDYDTDNRRSKFLCNRFYTDIEIFDRGSIRLCIFRVFFPCFRNCRIPYSSISDPLKEDI